MSEYLSLLPIIALGLIIGFVFGIALEKSRVFEPGVIIGQMQLRSFLMLKVFLAATITGMLALAALTAFDAASLHPKALNWQGNLIGGLILGGGLVLAGACPGTTLAQIGAGYKDAWFTFVGALGGALAYGYLESSIKPVLLDNNAGKVTYHNLLGVPYWGMALVVAGVLIVALIILERLRPWQRELGSDVDGLLEEISASQSSAAPLGKAGA